MDQASALFMLRIINITVIITGLIGNIITFVVYSRPTFRKNTVGLYCRALAIADSFTIYNVVVVFYHILFSYSINTYSNLVCKLNYYIVWGLGSIPGWILIAFAIDKIMSLKKVSPNRLKKSYIHYMIILGIVILNLLVYIELPIYMNLKAFQIRGSTVYSCSPAYFEFGSTVNWIYITEGSIIPFVVMFFSSIYTVKLLRDSSRNVGMLGLQAEKRSSRDKKFAITSLTFNVLFIALRMPYLVTLLVSGVNFYFQQIASLLFFFNYVISLFVHFVSNSLFRRELLIMLRIRKSAGDSTATFPIQNTNKKS